MGLGEETSWTEKSSGCTDLGASGGSQQRGGGWGNKDITLCCEKDTRRLVCVERRAHDTETDLNTADGNVKSGENNRVFSPLFHI